MEDLDELEVLDGLRAWDEAQAAFQGTLDTTRTRWLVDLGWYDTSIDDREGAFAMVQQGSDLEEMVGDVVRVDYGSKVAYVYMLGGADLSAPMSLSRPAYFRLAMLSVATIPVAVQPVKRA
jgi:hypothetical protein